MKKTSEKRATDRMKNTVKEPKAGPAPDRQQAHTRSDPLAGIKPDREQRAVIDSPARVIQVQAYAGTGKTTTLGLRQRRLVKHDAEAGDFLAITLTKTGEKELRKKLLPGTEVRTIHSLAHWLVHQDQGRMPEILDLDGELALIGRAAGIEAEKLKTGSRRRATLIEIRDQPRAQHNARALLEMMAIKGLALDDLINGPDGRWAPYRPYLPALKLLEPRVRKLKLRASKFSFADLIGPAMDAVNAGIKLSFTHLMVDEWQDCTPAQALLIQALIPQVQSTVLVGDRHQEIFGFAGARFSDLSESLPDVLALPLTRSWRLTDRNAALATSLIRQTDSKAAAVRGTQGQGRRPQLWARLKAKDQAEAVAVLVRKLVARGVPHEDIAILGRTRAMLRNVERDLRGKGLESDARFRKGHDFIRLSLDLMEALGTLHFDQGSPEVTDKYLRSHAVTAALRDLMTRVMPSKGVAQTTVNTNVRKLKATLQPRQSLQARLAICNQVVLSLSQASRKAEGKNATDADTADRLTRWEPIAADPEIKTVRQLRRHIERQRKAARVRLSTIHAAKGAQWPQVIVLNVVDGGIPLSVGGSISDLEHERNALYVACTRASERLYLMEAPRKGKAERSPFLADKKTLAALARR